MTARAMRTSDENELGREALGEEPRAVERSELLVSTHGLTVDQDERDCPLPAEIPHALAERRIVVERDLVEVEATRIEQRLRADTESAPLRRIEDDSRHQEA